MYAAVLVQCTHLLLGPLKFSRTLIPEKIEEDDDDDERSYLFTEPLSVHDATKIETVAGS